MKLAGLHRVAFGDARGFTLIEAMVALALMLVIIGAVFTFVTADTSMAYAQPEAGDMQQRARVATDLLSRDLAMAGAGIDAGPRTGALISRFAPIVPRRMGLSNADAYTVARADAVTIAFVPNTYSQTTLQSPLFTSSNDLTVADLPSCPQGHQLCGMTEGMTILICDDQGHFDFFTVTGVQGAAGHLRKRQPSASYPYQPGNAATQADWHTYYYDAANHQLRHYDGDQTDVPVVDNVVGVVFEYFGDPNPPTRPKPPLGTANCLYDAEGNSLGALTVLTTQGGSLAPLPLSLFNNGPWCGAGDNRFDADLLRIRSVRVTLRVQASPQSMRRAGTGADNIVSGTSTNATRTLADYTVVFEISPRNMNLGR